jgi:hypothetical protein
MMVGNAQYYRIFGLCPSSGILKTEKNTMFRKLDLFPSSSEIWETPTLLDPLETANLSHWTTYVWVWVWVLCYYRRSVGQSV